MGAHRSGDPATLDRVLGAQRAHLLAESRALAGQAAERAADPVVSLLIANARLPVDADLRLVATAEATLKPGSATAHRPARDRAEAPAEDAESA